MDLEKYFAEHKQDEVYIKCSSEEQFNCLMSELEGLGVRWVNGGEKPTEFRPPYNFACPDPMYCVVDVELMELSWTSMGCDSGCISASEIENRSNTINIRAYIGEREGVAFLCRSEEEFDLLFEMVMSDCRNAVWWAELKERLRLKKQAFEVFKGRLCVGFYRYGYDVIYAEPEFYTREFGEGSVFPVPVGAKASESTIIPSDDLVEFLLNLIEGGSARDT